MKKILLAVHLFITICITGTAQDITSLTNIVNQKAFSINGSVGASTSFYQSNEVIPSRPAIAWAINGAINPAIYGFAFPLSFVITQSSHNFNYSLPSAPVFSQFGISPSYKWVKLYLGYRAMHFSQFTFDGQTFLGAGIELTPKIFRFSAFYGILNKAVQGDTSALNYRIPQYKRKAWGVKIGIGTINNYFDLIYFHAKDDSSSIRFDPNSLIRPEENHVFGMAFRFTIKKSLYITGEAVGSLVNTDLGFQRIAPNEESTALKNSINLFNVSYATQVGFAGKVLLGYNLKAFHISIAYQRIWPDFVSFGTPYTTNDIEGLIGNAGIVLNKGKENLNLTVNAQHNDLDHNLATETRTLTGTLTLVTVASKHFVISWNGTGTYLQQESGTVAVTDTIRQNQLIFTGTVVPTYNFQHGTVSHTISLSGNVMFVDNLNPFMENSNSSNISSTLSYNSFFSTKSLTFNCSANYNRYLSSFSESNSIGIHTGLSGQLLKDKGLGLQGNIGYQENIFKPGGNLSNITTGANISYRFFKHHLITATINYILTPQQKAQAENPYAVTTTNLTAGLAYVYNFSYTTKK